MQTETQGKKLSRRQALLGALLAGAGAAARPAAAADASCSCLPAPDCNAVCPNGGVPRGDGTQACDCVEIPQNVPPRALALVDGGDAVNSTRWNGKELRLNHNTGATWIPVITGNYVDYILKSEISGSLPQIGAQTFSSNQLTINGSYYSVSASRDIYGRLTGVGFTRNNCNCCNCGDDSGCFIKAELLTTNGPKSVDSLVPGDMLIGIDGIHKIVGIAVNVLGNRTAVSVSSHGDTWLTQEHIVLHKGFPTVRSKNDYLLNKELLTAPNGVTGRYAHPALDELIQVDETVFVPLNDIPSETRTYSPIVESGCWAMTKDGLNVLLCREI